MPSLTILHIDDNDIRVETPPLLDNRVYGLLIAVRCPPNSLTCHIPFRNVERRQIAPSHEDEWCARLRDATGQDTGESTSLLGATD